MVTLVRVELVCLHKMPTGAVSAAAKLLQMSCDDSPSLLRRRKMCRSTPRSELEIAMQVPRHNELQPESGFRMRMAANDMG